MRVVAGSGAFCITILGIADQAPGLLAACATEDLFRGSFKKFLQADI